MPSPADPLLLTAIALVALLYASVGHAGASGYIAVLALVLVVAGLKLLGLKGLF